jgi:hypothetical protein
MSFLFYFEEPWEIVLNLLVKSLQYWFNRVKVQTSIVINKSIPIFFKKKDGNEWNKKRIVLIIVQSFLKKFELVVAHRGIEPLLPG